MSVLIAIWIFSRVISATFIESKSNKINWPKKITRMQWNTIERMFCLFTIAGTKQKIGVFHGWITNME